jgi:hypothetical protein
MRRFLAVSLKYLTWFAIIVVVIEICRVVG